MSAIAAVKTFKSLSQVYRIIKEKKGHDKITHGTVRVIIVDHISENGDSPCSLTSRCFRVGSSGRFNVSTECISEISRLVKVSHDAGSNIGEQKEYVLTRKLLNEKELVKIDDYGKRTCFRLSTVEVPGGPKFKLEKDSSVKIQLEDGSFEVIDITDTENLKSYFPQKSEKKYKFDVAVGTFESLRFKLSCKALDGSEPNVLNSSSFTVVYFQNGVYSFVPGSQLEEISKTAEGKYPNFTQIIGKALFTHRIQEISDSAIWNYFCTLLVSSFQASAPVPVSHQADHVVLMKAGELYCYEIESKNFQKSISKNLRVTVPRDEKKFSADEVNSSQVTLRLSTAWKTVNIEYEK